MIPQHVADSVQFIVTKYDVNIFDVHEVLDALKAEGFGHDYTWIRANRGLYVDWCFETRRRVHYGQEDESSG